MKNKIGIITIFIGILHVGLGLFKYSQSFGEMVANGILNSVTTNFEKLAFWFTISGFLIMLIGYLITYIEKNSMTLPIELGWMLIALAMIGVIVIPKSGFWAIFLPATLIVLSNRRT